MFEFESLCNDGTGVYSGCGPVCAHDSFQVYEKRLLLYGSLGSVLLRIQGMYMDGVSVM